MAPLSHIQTQAQKDLMEQLVSLIQASGMPPQITCSATSSALVSLLVFVRMNDDSPELIAFITDLAGMVRSIAECPPERLQDFKLTHAPGAYIH